MRGAADGAPPEALAMAKVESCFSTAPSQRGQRASSLQERTYFSKRTSHGAQTYS
jgi:hypothetical protein